MSELFISEDLNGKVSERKGIKTKKKGFHVSNFLTRRTNEEILQLSQYFKKTIQESPELNRRVSYFWSTQESLERLLFTLAEDIPKGHNPLWKSDENEIFDHEESNTKEEEDNQISTREAQTTLSSNLKKRIKKRQTASLQPKCVEWLGLVNANNGYATIKVFLPVTEERWVTWTNRIIAFLFREIPLYESPEDFVRILRPPYKGPFIMQCKNPRCVRLSHMQCALKNTKHLRQPEKHPLPSLNLPDLTTLRSPENSPKPNTTKMKHHVATESVSEESHESDNEDEVPVHVTKMSCQEDSSSQARHIPNPTHNNDEIWSAGF